MLGAMRGTLDEPGREHPSYVTLSYGKTWKGSVFTCTSRLNGVTCKNRAGHGLFVSRQSWRAFRAMRGARVRRAAVCVVVVGALAAVLLAVLDRGSRHLRSEGSHQIAYAAPLGLVRTRPAIVRRLTGHVARRTAPRCASLDWKPSLSVSHVAVVRRAGTVWLRRGAGRIVERFGRTDQNGYPTVFEVVGAYGAGCRPAWLRVQVSSPPNGRTGWVRGWLVRTYTVNTRIVVRLSQRRLFFYRGGKRVFSTGVAVGAAQTPTPAGRFFVNERFLLSDPSGPFGVAALGVAAHSNALRDWVQGGPIGIHGTNEPGSIGQAASHGCIRLTNGAMRRLFALTPAGTPVVIRT
jgi:lipoprotein-anchoring transpeptidase ErfK/SrfK